MSKIDYQALREKAEKATCGVWSLEYGEERFDADDALIHREVAGYIPICRIEGAHPESGFDEDFQMEQQANAEFIAAANPATVLALLGELEAEPVAWKVTFTQIDHEYNTFTAMYSDKAEAERWVRLHKVGDFLAEITPLYAAPPAPVVPDDWQLVPKKITLEMECALSKADSYEIGWLWALAAAPKYEVQNAKRMQNALNACRAAMLKGDKS
ncbi:ead/Ea22-like family protein [Escherichia coli]|uniref:ead/Ea22-like family protein n=1 Tax=Escherichia coli TaxID=562 RepID=UPI000AE72407|nr:ead/Ea22-like family protein [Escherichia coli]